MNPNDEAYSEFVDSVEQCVQDVAEQHDIDTDVTVEKGGVTTVSISGEFAEGKPIHLTTAITADIERAIGSFEGFGANPEVDLPGREAVRPRLSTRGGTGPRNDAGVQTEVEEVEDQLERGPVGPLRSKEELAQECERMSK